MSLGVIFSQKGRHNVNSVRGRCNLLVYANYERVTSTLYLYSMVSRSIIHHFRYNQVLWWSGNDVIVFSPLGSAAGVQVKSECILCKSDHDFMLVSNNNHTSIMHRFRYNQVLPLTGNDFLLFSSLGGAAGSLSRWITGGWPRLYNNDKK